MWTLCPWQVAGRSIARPLMLLAAFIAVCPSLTSAQDQSAETSGRATLLAAERDKKAAEIALHVRLVDPRLDESQIS